MKYNRFSPDDLNGFLRKLLAKKSLLLEVKGELEQSALSLKPENIGELASPRLYNADQASNLQEQDTDLKIADNERLEILEINEAISRLANGTYGECQSCGELIPIARLNALPEAKHCIFCQRDLETEANAVQKIRPESMLSS